MLVDSRESVVEKYKKLVQYWANKFASAMCPADDLYGEGILGLMQAYDRYEPGRCEFKTYATWLIRGNMLDYCRKNRAVIGSSRGSEIPAVGSIDYKISRDDTIADTIPADYCLSTTVCNDIVTKQAQTHLKPKEAEVIENYYYGGKTMKVIGEEIGLSESRVFQLHKRAINKMREVLA